MSQLTTTPFTEIVQMIANAKQRAIQSVNTSLIDLYWQVGEIISRKIASAEWGDGVVNQLADHIAQAQPGLRGFTRRNLFRMRQFYETYKGDAIVSPLLTQLPWMHNLIILRQSNHPAERDAQTPRKHRHRRAAVRQQRRRSSRIRSKPHRVARLDRAV